MEVETGSIEERIINASFNILEKDGLAKATTKRIAKEADVSEVTLFRKFKSKKRLIEVAKEYYSNRLLEKLDTIFKYSDNETVEDYLTKCFDNIVNFSDNELKIIKIGMEEVREIPKENKVFLKIADMIITRLTEFFNVKIQRKEIRTINPEVLALNMFSILFESIILWKVYGKAPHYSIEKYKTDFLDIILNGIKSEV